MNVFRNIEVKKDEEYRSYRYVMWPDEAKRYFVMSDICINPLDLSEFPNYRFYTVSSTAERNILVIYEKPAATATFNIDLLPQDMYESLSQKTVETFKTLEWISWIANWDVYRKEIKQSSFPKCFKINSDKFFIINSQPKEKKSLNSLDGILGYLRDCADPRGGMNPSPADPPDWDEIIEHLNLMKDTIYLGPENESVFLELLWFIQQLACLDIKVIRSSDLKKLLRLEISTPPLWNEKLKHALANI